MTAKSLFLFPRHLIMAVLMEPFATRMLNQAELRGDNMQSNCCNNYQPPHLSR